MFDVSGHAALTLAKIGGGVSFADQLRANETSITWLYTFEANTGVDEVDVPAAPPPGYTAAGWWQNCGDYVLSRVVRGGRLHVAVRIQLADEDTAKEFKAHLDVNAGLGDLSTNIKHATQSYNTEGTITFVATQVGGDVGRLGNALDGGLVQCTLRRFEKCEAAMQHALGYSKDFGSQLAAHSVPIEYELRGWSDFNVGAPGLPTTSAIAQARGDLDRGAESAGAVRGKIDGLTRIKPLLSDVEASSIDLALARAMKLIQMQDDAVRQGVAVCYDSVDRPGAEASCLASAQRVRDLDNQLRSVPLTVPRPAVTFGGFYQTTDGCGGRGDILNPVTQSLGCPAGFAARPIARVSPAMSNCGGTQYMCVGDGHNRMSLRIGGYFQTIDGGPSADRGADPPNQYGCPNYTDWDAKQVGYVVHPENGGGSGVFICLPKSQDQWWTPGRPRYVSAFEVLDGNPLPKCPPGSVDIPGARVRKDGGGGAWLHLCRSQ